MKNNNKVLAIYGIKDININYPEISHDHSLVLFSDGKIEKFLQLERLTRKKHDNKLDQHIYSILKNEKLLTEKYNLVFVDNIIGRSFINKEGNIRFEAPLNEHLSLNSENGSAWWLNGHVDAFVVNHELAHVFSCLPFFNKYNDNSLLIHFDGGASKSNFSAWTFKKGKIQLVDYHWKLKYLSGFFNANALTFAVLKGNIKNHLSIPGKLMGYAAYGSYSARIEEWLKDNQYFEDIWSNKRIFIEKAKGFINENNITFDLHNPFVQDVMATIHYIFERDFVQFIHRLKNETNTDYLYYSGGSALNIKTNSCILNMGIFKDMFIPPCCNDSGLAIGAGAMLNFNQKGSSNFNTPYLNNIGLKNIQLKYTNETISYIADMIVQGKVVAICNGYGECGPRALGNRSILALASSTELAQKVSMEIKKREWYRPLAPIMLLKNALFYTGRKTIHHLSKYMLLEYKILDHLQKEIEGVVHVDGTSRIQVIKDKNENPFMYDLLNYLDENFQIKALINTSFNIAGEPMVHSSEDAILTARRMKLDAVVINGKVKTEI